ncbi:hypothetical protein P0Y35_13275 [Kiritimatiellaeota bacterium B1221]|nr:hypothetical protein [Kiritimatiellaeota bacterium B1221]
MLIASLWLSPLSADPVQVQELELAPGWNAVWLAVAPQTAEGKAADPMTVFGSEPDLTTVSRFLPARAPVQFIDDPSGAAPGGDFWLTWRRNTTVGENTLGSITGNAAYLIENSGDQPVTIQVTGEVAFHRFTWVPDAFNFIGVPTGSTPPTFADFFGPSPAHDLGQVFRLELGSWVAVNPNERMRENEAYWVFCSEGSSYQGPLPFIFQSADGLLDFGTERETMDVAAGNLLDDPAGLHLVRVFQDGFDVFDAVSAGRIVDYAITQTGAGSGTLPSRTSAPIRLEVRRDWTGGEDTRSNLYRVEARLPDGSSYYQFLPVRASVPTGLPTAGESGDPLPGLWVGDVLLTQSTSVVDGKTDSGTTVGPRLEAVRRPLRYRLLLHVDDTGTVRLLSDATILQRTIVDEGIPPEYIIVLDENDIPNFVGIEERGGRLVGQRFDTAAYDLPRSVIPPVSADSTVNFDPATLSSEYLESLELDGELVPGGLISTVEGSFTLDPWHRTNPYRHAFHPEHQRGFRVTREWTLHVDEVNSEEAQTLTGFGSTLFSGVFTETITGLGRTSPVGSEVNPPGEALQARGRFSLRRVNSISTLE